MWSEALVPSNGYATSCGEQSESTPVPTALYRDNELEQQKETGFSFIFDP